LTTLGRNLSVSHLAGFMATVHWTTSFLAWVECTERPTWLSRKKYKPSGGGVAQPQSVVDSAKHVIAYT
jgi:hypothetical protein